MSKAQEKELDLNIRKLIANARPAIAEVLLSTDLRKEVYYQLITSLQTMEEIARIIKFKEDKPDEGNSLKNLKLFE